MVYLNVYIHILYGVKIPVMAILFRRLVIEQFTEAQSGQLLSLVLHILRVLNVIARQSCYVLIFSYCHLRLFYGVYYKHTVYNDF